jgi:cysteine desulfurase/selenocysteine lyase
LRLAGAAVRGDFPVFEQRFNGKRLAYLDSAASAQKPRQVLDAMRDFYETSYANVHRGVYALSERATAGYEGARGKVAAFVNAPSTREVIFTRNATEALNLVVYAWGLNNHKLRRSDDLRSAPLLTASIFVDVLNVFLLFLSIFSRGE